MKTFLKEHLVPRGAGERRMPAGLARGTHMNLDLRAGNLRTYAGLYEFELRGPIRRLWRPGLSTFDVGGAQGYYTLAFARLTGSRVLAFECDPVLADELRRNVALNPRLEPLIQTVDLAVGSSTGDREITLDDAAERYFAPDLVKMDIEGAEVAALAGADRLLRTHRPSFLIEVHGFDVEQSCVRTLAGHDYLIEPIDQRKWLPESRPIAHNRWIVATPK